MYKIGILMKVWDKGFEYQLHAEYTSIYRMQ